MVSSWASRQAGREQAWSKLFAETDSVFEVTCGCAGFELQIELPFSTGLNYFEHKEISDGSCLTFSAPSLLSDGA